MTSDTTPEPNDTTDRAVQIVAQSLAQGLMEAEVILAADRAARERQIPAEVIDTLERFSAVLTRLVEHTEQLAERMADLTEAVAALAEARIPEAAPGKPQLPEMEPSFSPGGEGVDVTIAAVPGFQGLMELQRALVRLPQVQSAAVRRYQDDEAAIQLVLVTADGRQRNRRRREHGDGQAPVRRRVAAGRAAAAPALPGSLS